MQPRTLTLRATAIALDQTRRESQFAADVTDIQRLLAWYFGDSTRPERRDTGRKAA